MPPKKKHRLYAIYKKGSLGGKRWKFDFDYIDELNDKEKEFYNAFLEEYYNANFNHKGKKLHKSVAKKREIYRLNNAANRCITSLKGSKTYDVETTATEVLEQSRDLTVNNIEDALIEYFDSDPNALEEELLDSKSKRRSRNRRS